MIRKSLLSLMLLAIAYSQILGGIACCCFVRVVSEQLHGLTNTVATVEVKEPGGEIDSHFDDVVISCPKCASRAKVRAEVASEDRVEDVFERGDGGEVVAPCLCGKFGLAGSEINEAPILKTKIGGAEWIVPRFANPTNQTLERVRWHVPPPWLPLGKHSWQSMACVWRN